MSDSGGNNILDKFKTFCRCLNIEQAFSSLHHNHSNTGRSMHQTYKANTQKCCDTKSDPDIALLQIRSTPLMPGLPSLTTLLFNCPIRDVMPTINRPPIGVNNSDDHYEELIKRQTKN